MTDLPPGWTAERLRSETERLRQHIADRGGFIPKLPMCYTCACVEEP